MNKSLKQLREDFAQKIRKDKRESLFKTKRIIPLDYNQLPLNNPIVVQIYNDAFNYIVNDDQTFNFDTTENQQIFLLIILYRFVNEIDDSGELLQNCEQSTDQIIELIFTFINPQNPKLDYMYFEILAYFTYTFSDPCQTILSRFSKQMMYYYQQTPYEIIKTKILTIYCNIAAENQSNAFDIFNLQIIHNLFPQGINLNLSPTYLVELGYLLKNLINSDPPLTIPILKQLIPIQQKFLTSYSVQIHSYNSEELRQFLKSMLTLFESVPASQEFQTEQFSLFLIDLIPHCKAKCITEIVMILNRFHEEIQISYSENCKVRILSTIMQTAKLILNDNIYDEQINNYAASRRIKYRLFSACLVTLSNEEYFIQFAILNNFHEFLIDQDWKDFPLNYCYEQLLNFIRMINETNQQIINYKNFKIFLQLQQSSDQFDATLALSCIELFKNINPQYFDLVKSMIEQFEVRFKQNEEVQNEIEQLYQLYQN